MTPKGERYRARVESAARAYLEKPTPKTLSHLVVTCVSGHKDLLLEACDAQKEKNESRGG